MDPNIYSVSEITRHIKNMFERNIPTIALEGEISNYKNHYSGHAYFSLKDENAQINAVMWKSAVQNSGFDFKDGTKVICHGNVTVYEKAGRYQMNVTHIEESGKGDLHQRFEALKKELLAKGYFDDSRKKLIPFYPTKIGIVTSPTGAAIEDMVSVASRRNKTVQLIIRPAKVQGVGAEIDIANGIKDFNEFGGVDVIVIGRGGGSLEDLWAFNEEIVADAIFNSRIPVLSAVGHEIDFSISDFVSDRRAPTPSSAMEILIPDQNEMIGQLGYFQDKITQLMITKLENNHHKIVQLKDHYALKKPEALIDLKRLRLNEISTNIIHSLKSQLLMKSATYKSIKNQIHALAPQNVLKRGYTILLQNSKVVDQSEKLNDGKVEIMFADKNIEKTIS